jgi:hypothetical protein
MCRLGNVVWFVIVFGMVLKPVAVTLCFSALPQIAVFSSESLWLRFVNQLSTYKKIKIYKSFISMSSALRAHTETL